MLSHLPVVIPRLSSRLGAVVALVRLQEFVLFTLVVTLLGANVGGARPGARLLIVLLGNLLSVAFAFMINDVEDASDDALVPTKAARNPISAGRLSPRVGYGVSLVVALGGLVLYAALGMWPLALGGLCLVLGALYSWRQVRLKAIPVADLISHALILAVLQFLCAYTAFQSGGRDWLVPCLLVAITSMHSQLFNQLRDLDVDRQVGINHTAARIGRRATQSLMVSMLVVALGLLALSVWQASVPPWTTGLGISLSPVLLVVLAQRARLAGSILDAHVLFRGPILSWAVVVLLAWLTEGVLAR